MCIRVLRSSLLSKRILTTTSVRAFASKRILTPYEVAFHEQGILDERGLTVFDTLYEMQVRSCQVFASHKLFGTYSNETKQFEWMKFHEYAAKVDTCRAVLRDLGEFLYAEGKNFCGKISGLSFYADRESA
jgi:hypothetical protein